MPNRYSLDLRPRQRGPDAGDYLQQGLTGALAARERERQEENRIRASGGTIVETPNRGIRGKLSSIGSAIRRGIVGDDRDGDLDGEGYGTVAQAGTPPRSTMDDFLPEPGPFGGVMADGSDNRPYAPGLTATPPILPPRGADPRDRRTFGRLPNADRDFGFGGQSAPAPQGGGRIFAPGSVSGARPGSMPGQTPAINGNAPDPRASIASSIRRPSPYTQRTEGGQTYTVDPMYQSNVALAGEEDKYQVAQGHRHETEEEQIKALTDAGMPAAEARARVLNNVVRYDEEFGQRYGSRGANAMSQADRLQIQDRIDARERQKQRIQVLLANSRTLTANQRLQMDMEMRRLDRESANDRALLSSAQSEYSATERDLTRMQTDPVVANTPAGQQAIAGQKAQAEAAKGNVEAARGRLQPKRKLTQQQYDQARAKYTDAQLANGYDLSGVKRKP